MFAVHARDCVCICFFWIAPVFLTADNLGTPVLRNPPLSLEGRRNENGHKMACETSSWKVGGFFFFSSENQGDKRRAPFGNLEAFPFAEQPKSKQTPTLTSKYKHKNILPECGDIIRINNKNKIIQKEQMIRIKRIAQSHRPIINFVKKTSGSEKCLYLLSYFK